MQTSDAHVAIPIAIGASDEPIRSRPRGWNMLMDPGPGSPGECGASALKPCEIFLVTAPCDSERRVEFLPPKSSQCRAGEKHISGGINHRYPAGRPLVRFEGFATRDGWRGGGLQQIVDGTADDIRAG